VDRPRIVSHARPRLTENPLVTRQGTAFRHRNPPLILKDLDSQDVRHQQMPVPERHGAPTGPRAGSDQADPHVVDRAPRTAADTG